MLENDQLNSQLQPLLLKPPSKNELYFDGIAKRASEIMDGGHNEREIMHVVMQDIKAIGGPQALMQISIAGKLSKDQFDICERIAVKLLAMCAIQKNKLGS